MIGLNKFKVKSLYKSFGLKNKYINVLKGINFEFIQGKGYAITGVSGSGKSTLLHLLGGLDVPTAGTVFFNNKDIFKLKSKEKDLFLNENIGFVFQFHYLIKELSVLENIILMGLIKGENRSYCEKKAKDLLEKFDLQEKIHSYPAQLSGGQLQRISILRAIFNKPKFLLADEPTGDLDAQNAKLITDFFLKCKKEWNMGLIICSHDKAMYDEMDIVLKLDNGILKRGMDPETILG